MWFFKVDLNNHSTDLDSAEVEMPTQVIYWQCEYTSELQKKN